MSITSIRSGMNRIKSASPNSPIAIFRRPIGYRPVGKKSPLVDPALDYVFGHTVCVSAALRRGDPDLVGIFDGSQDLDAVEIKLRALARGMHGRRGKG